MRAERSPLEKVFALRPTNAALRLGAESRVALLNPRELVPVSTEDAALLVLPALPPKAMAGPLRAARDADAPLGLCCAHPFERRDVPHAFFEAARASAEETHFRAPLFLEGGPVRVESADPLTVERAAADVFSFVDAGFGLVSIDASGLHAEDAVDATQRTAATAVERELALEVSAPVREGRADPGALGKLLDGLAKAGVEPRFVRVESRALGVELPSGGGWALDVPLLETVRGVAEEHGAALCAEERGPPSVRDVAAWVQAGVRKIRPADTFARFAQLPPERAEALAYCETGDWLGPCALVGRGSRLIRSLCERSRD